MLFRSEIVDQVVFNKAGENKNIVTCWSDWTCEHTECLILAFQIGLACSVESPGDRTDLRRVALELLSIKGKFLSTKTHEMKILSSVNK